MARIQSLFENVGTGMPTFNAYAKARSICRVCQRDFAWYPGMPPAKQGVSRCPDHPAKPPKQAATLPNEAGCGAGTTPAA